MQCKCGSEITESTHAVKTQKGFSQWHDAPFDKSKAPYSVSQVLCRSCGRVGSIIVRDNEQAEVLPRWPELYI